MSSESNRASKSESTTSSENIASKVVEKNNLKKTPGTHAQCVLSEADRQHMIAVAAYYRAEKRGFNNGDEIQDWLEAEAEIDSGTYNLRGLKYHVPDEIQNSKKVEIEEVDWEEVESEEDYAI